MSQRVYYQSLEELCLAGGMIMYVNSLGLFISLQMHTSKFIRVLLILILITMPKVSSL
jgi:hypothetical protein